MKKLLIGLSMFFGLLISGCGTPSPLCLGNPNFFVSPSRIERSQLDTEVDKLRYFRTLEMQGDYDYKSLEIIGHAAASFKHYPMNIDKSLSVVGNYDTKAIDVSKLIDVAFYSDDIDSIEIDVYVAASHLLCKNQDKKNCSFIMHDTPAWGDINNSTTSEAFKYMQRNTLLKVLTHFVKQDYHLKNKRLYLEIKTCPLPNQENNSSCTADASKRIVEDIKDIIDKNYLGEGRENWLTIVSFSPTALSNAYQKLSKNSLEEKVDYALIAGYDKKGFCSIKESLAQCKGPVPQFNKNIENFVLSNAWIDRVWFSTKGITNPNEMFKNMYNKRKDIKFSVSSYDNYEKSFYETMKQFKLPLASIMIDVDD